jgi:hypothetical protein
LAQDVFVGAASSAAPGQLAVDHDSRQAAHAMLLRASRDAFLVHIVDLDIVVRTCDFADHIDSFLAGRAPGAEDFDFVFLGHNPFSLQFACLADAPRARGRQPDRPAIPNRCDDKNAQSRIRRYGRFQIKLPKQHEDTCRKTRNAGAVAPPLTSAECEGGHGDGQKRGCDHQQVP